MNLYKYFYKHFSSTTSERPVLAGVQSEVFKVMLSLDNKCKWIIIGNIMSKKPKANFSSKFVFVLVRLMTELCT